LRGEGGSKGVREKERVIKVRASKLKEEKYFTGEGEDIHP